jgi:GR25 family glycosyltransferase involved in LPS biosynthesis
VKDLPDNLTATRPRGPLGSAFDRVRIINLRRRSDRRAETLRELVALGESVDGYRLGFFDAVEPDDAGGFPSPGVRGCYLSHLAVLEAAAGDDVSMLLVMEDDVAFVRDADDLLVEAIR